MSRYFQIGELFFYPQKNEIHQQSDIRKVRPKTAELLCVLLDARGEIVSKSELLNQVWNDVIVEEHVVFQSIAELRKIFDDASIIKTHPRKGYSVTTSIKELSEKPLTKASQIPTAKNKKGSWVKYVSVVSVFIFASLLYYSLNETQPLNSSGSIIVLPVKNHIEDADHLWLKYGGMDLLIKYLKPQMDITVLQTEDVLDIIKRADIAIESLDAKAISRIFEVSGAELVIEQSLSGSTRDYQLVYSLHKRSGTKRGALFSENAESLFVDLNSRILDFTGNRKTEEPRSYHNDFANELVAQAMDQFQDKNYAETATLLKAVLVTEPNNLTAHKLLAQVLLYTGEYIEAEQASAAGLQIAIDTGNDLERVRILFWHALSITQQKRFVEALALLGKAKEQAKATKDLLYVADISRIIGRIHLSQQKYNLAKAEFEEALLSHGAIQCPFGRSNTLIDMGELAYLKNDFDEANSYFNDALSIAQKRHLDNTIKLAKEWLEKSK